MFTIRLNIPSTAKKALGGAALGIALSVTAAQANVSTETANGTTTVVATTSQQTNIVQTITGGGASTIGITTTAGPAPTVSNVSIPAGTSIPSGGGQISVTVNGTATTLTATPDGSGNFDVVLPSGETVKMNGDGQIIQVNQLFGPDGQQYAMIEQFSFNRSDGFNTTQSGASAGGADGKLSIWINGGYSTFDEDQAAIDADGDTWTVAVGGDWQFSERFIGGLSFAGSLSDVTTTFNNGDIETTGYTISPYFVTILGANKNFLIDGALGYTVNDNDATRSNGTVTSNYDSSSTFVSGNLTYIFNHGNLRVQPKVGMLYLWNTTDGYTESTGTVVPESKTKLGRLSAGAKLEYTKNPKFTPFISITGEYDWETEDYSSFTGGNRPSVEDTGAVLGAGFSTQLSEKVTGDLSGTTSLGRDKYEAYSLSGTLRFSF